jgi:hypothetical protein
MIFDIALERRCATRTTGKQPILMNAGYIVLFQVMVEDFSPVIRPNNERKYVKL